MTDVRILAWRALFDSETSFEVIGAPTWIWDHLNGDSSGPRVLLTWGESEPSFHKLGQYQSLVAVNGRTSIAPRLSAAGFGWVRSFAIVPSLDDPRFLIPLESPKAASRALRLYSPFTLKGRTARLGAMLAARTGKHGWYRDYLVVAAREQPPLERLLVNSLGLGEPHLAFSTGRPLAQRKVTVGALDAQANWSGFLKQGEGPWVQSALENEARWLRHLANSPLAATIPRLLGHRVADCTTSVVVSAGPECQSSGRVRPEHVDWLATLASETSATRPYSESNLARRLRSEWPVLRSRVTPEWSIRIEQASNRLRREFGHVNIQLSACHGDFTPWNIRQLPDRRIYVFDWEMARADVLPLHDLFHFHFMQRILTGQTLGPNQTSKWIDQHLTYLHPAVPSQLVRSLFAGFLIETAMTYLELLVARQGTRDDDVLSAAAELLDSSRIWWAEKVEEL